MSKDYSMISIVDMYKKLANQTDKIIDPELTRSQRREEIEKAEAASTISKQALNAANIILKADKMKGNTDRIDALIGEVVETEEK